MPRRKSPERPEPDSQEPKTVFNPRPHSAYIDIADACVVAAKSLRLFPEQVERARLAAKQMLLQGSLAKEMFLYQFCEAIPADFKLAVESMGMSEDEFKQALDSRELKPEVFFTKLAKAM